MPGSGPCRFSGLPSRGGDGHSLAINAEHLKSTQALTRQSTERITMDIYSHVLADERTEASRTLCPLPKFSTVQHPWVLKLFLCRHKPLIPCGLWRGRRAQTRNLCRDSLAL